jgi:hypothetical protein
MENTTMPSRRRILYACPDSPEPSGGVRRLYRHVEILNKHDLWASIVHASPGFRITWFEHNAPICYRSSLAELSQDDVLVIPEVMTSLMKEVEHSVATRVAIGLNWAYIYMALPAGEDWKSYGINHAIAGSQYEREFILKTMGINAHVLVSGIDSDLFRPATDKRLQIAFMPRKMSLGDAIFGAFRLKYPQLSHVPIVRIENQSHRGVAEVLSKAAIFVTATLVEGLARPPLEAMSAGCIVVGFAGRGSLEYMAHKRNCYLAEDGDVFTAADYLAEAVQRVSNGDAISLQESAQATAGKYSLDSEEKEVTRF